MTTGLELSMPFLISGEEGQEVEIKLMAVPSDLIYHACVMKPPYKSN